MKNKIQVVCRIRQPDLQSQKQQFCSKSPTKYCSKFHRSPSPRTLSKDLKVQVFVATPGRGANKQIKLSSKQKLIGVSQNPISQQLIEQYIQSDSDLLKFKPTILGNCKVFKFDKIFNQHTTQEKIYQELAKDKISLAINGISSNFIIVGPAGGGKNYTFRGKENDEKGLIMNSVNDLINLIEISQQNNSLKLSSSRGKNNFKLTAQIFCVTQNEVIDLLSKSNSTTEKFTYNLTSKEQKVLQADIKILSDFRSLYRSAINQLVQYSNEGVMQLENSNVFVKLMVYKNNNLWSALTFLKMEDFKNQNSDFSKQFMEFIVKCQNVSESPIQQQYQSDNKLIQILQHSLNQHEETQAIIINTVCQLPDSYKQTLDSIDFISKIKENAEFQSEQQMQQMDSEFQSKKYQDLDTYLEEINELVTRIFQFSQVTEGLNAAEKQEWIQIQLNKIQNYLNELQSQGSVQQLSTKDHVLKLQEAKQFLVDTNAKLEDVPTQPVKLEENLLTSQSQPMSQRDSLNNKKQAILQRIDRAIQENRSMNRSNSQLVTKQQELENAQIESQLFKEKQKSKIDNQLYDEKISILEDNIKRRDKIIQDQEEQIVSYKMNLDKERNNISVVNSRTELLSKNEQDLKFQNQKMRMKVSKKKELIQSMHENIKQLEEESAHQRSAFATEKQVYEQSMEELKQQLDIQKMNSQELKSQLQKTREILENQQEKQMNLEQNFTQQDRQLQIQVHDLEDVNKELKISNQIKDKKFEDLLCKSNYAEEQLNKLKQQLEQEQFKSQEEKNKEILKRKQKTKKLKLKIKEVCDQIAKLSEEGVYLKQQNNQLSQQNKNNLEEMASLKATVDLQSEQLSGLKQSESQLEEKCGQYETLIKKQINEINKLEKEKKRLTVQVEQVTQINQKFEEDFNAQFQQIEQYKQQTEAQTEQIQVQNEVINKIEKQNQYLQQMQNDDIKKLEDQIITINEEQQKLKDENLLLKQIEQDLKNEVTQAEQTKTKFREKLIQNKLTIKELKEQIKEMNEKIGDMILEKNNEIINSRTQSVSAVKKTDPIQSKDLANNEKYKYLLQEEDDDDEDEEDQNQIINEGQNIQQGKDANQNLEDLEEF